MAVDFTALQAEVTANTNVKDSILSLISSLADQITALKVGADAATQAKIDDFVNTLRTNDQALATAVTTNTSVPPGA